MEIREVHEDMTASVKKFLANREGFRDANDWDGLFNYPWKLQGYPYGYAIMDQEKMIGFLGTIFSERLIAGTTRICCNTTSWFVEEEYRAQMLALRLFAPLLKMKDLLITNLSPTDGAKKICENMGYEYLDQEQIAIPVLPGIASIWGSGRKRLVVSFERNEIQSHLNQEERKIFEDHCKLACTHFLLRDLPTGEYCYGIATTTPLGRLRTLRGQWLSLCYLSNASMFARNFRFIKKDLWIAGRFVALRYDARFLPGKLSRLAVRKKKTRQYKSKEPISWTVDNIYSELVTFNKY
ncbi:MAG TPA: hypothetical protein VFN26_13605 [Candidatus Acidoferrum sp.]|nr:hypothetical protein [Candidatus Acidoferrum sp.]